MSGLLALLDDVSAIAKVAASSVDDIAASAAEASSKTAGVVIDDAAVTPKYLHGFKPARELPIIWRIARGSLFNKVVILTPIALLLANFAPFVITPLLMLGGSYLCFEGAEKVFHAIYPHDEHVEKDLKVKDPGHLEEKKVRGAIKTDFILSAEIMTIALSSMPKSTFWIEAAALVLVAVAVTVGVYGTVVLIVKMDDVGLYLAKRYETGILHAVGRGLVKGMPVLMAFLSVVGTAAMLWVGGQIIVHGLHDLGMHHPYEEIHHLAEIVAHAGPEAIMGLLEWATTALCDGVLGLLYGLLLIPVVTRGIGPMLEKAGVGGGGH
jgi:predicted DNA repair protein MutK